MISPPSGHTHLDFNAPLSDARAATLIEGLGPLDGARVVDLGCGWAELLLRLLAAAPGATGVGVDTDEAAIGRGRTNASARSLDTRVELLASDVTAWAGDPADVVLSVGASHAWGRTTDALGRLRAFVRPGGRLLFGDGIWARAPTPTALAALDATPEEFFTLGDLVDHAIGLGYRPLAISVATLDEWDSFESRWCAGRERWLLDHPDHPDAPEARRVVDEHRTAWLHGYRGILGFAYLTLAVPRDP